MRSWVAMLGLLVACGNVGQDAGVAVDDATQDVRSADSRTICDPTAKFDVPVVLPGFNTAGWDGVPRLTADELEIYFDFFSDSAPDRNIYRARRSDVSQSFGTPLPVTEVNSGALDGHTSVSGDGLALVLESTRAANEGWHIYISTRGSRAGEFDPPSKIANINSIAIADNDTQPFVTADAQELWFASTRPGGLGSFDIFRATWNGSSFGDVAAALELNTSAADCLPTLSADKLTIYLASTRPGGKGAFDIWTAHRSTIHDGFPPLTPVAELNSDGTDYPGWLSPDNCRLYLSSDRAGSEDIYVATRHPM